MPASVRSVTSAVVSVLICLTGLPGRTLSQTQQPSKEQTEVVRVYTELVQTDVTVFDKDGRFKNDLQREDFELKIDGKVKPIAFFERITAGTKNEKQTCGGAGVQLQHALRGGPG